MLFSLLPFEASQQLYQSNVIGASGAIYGLLLAYAMYFPDRPIYMYFSSRSRRNTSSSSWARSRSTRRSNAGGGVANATHLGGLLVAYLYLKGLRMKLSPFAEVKYRYVKWRINKMRRKFDVYSGGGLDGSTKPQSRNLKTRNSRANT